jgi:hypothetical protein
MMELVIANPGVTDPYIVPRPHVRANYRKSVTQGEQVKVPTPR